MVHFRPTNYIFQPEVAYFRAITSGMKIKSLKLKITYFRRDVAFGREMTRISGMAILPVQKIKFLDSE